MDKLELLEEFKPKIQNNKGEISKRDLEMLELIIDTALMVTTSNGCKNIIETYTKYPVWTENYNELLLEIRIEIYERRSKYLEIREYMKSE